jgi:hypothetical protein
MSIRAKEDDLNQKILGGKALDAFEEYYADDVVMKEGNEDRFEGKNTNRDREKDFFSSVERLNALELRSVAYGDGVTVSEWHYDFVHTDWGHQKFDQVAVRRWNDNGLVAEEQFYKAAVA